jgi:small subunit ribosomal protein S3Ae
MFGETHIADTPAMDPKSVAGRAIEVGVPEVTGNDSKYYMKLRFKIDNVSDRNAHTSFAGLFSLRDYIARMTRKRSSKIRVISNIKTKDNWSLRMSVVAILLNKTDVNVQKKVREHIVNFLNTNSSKSDIETLIKSAVNGFIQKNIKTSSSKLYPVRFTEIEKIEVLKAPAG